MMICEFKPNDELFLQLAGYKKLFIMACNGCAGVFGAGGPAGVKKAKQILSSMDKKVSGYCYIDYTCEKSHDQLWMNIRKEEFDKADAILVISCGIGVQAVASLTKKPVYPALNTLSLGGRVGQSWGLEQCKECGDCILADTAGICPMTACGKHLLNGPCGGSKDGKCEVYPEKDCGWITVYNRFKERDQLEAFKKIHPPKRFDRTLPSAELIKTSYILANGGGDVK